MTEIYKKYCIIDGRPRWIIVDDNENIINSSPTREELKELKIDVYVHKSNNKHRIFVTINEQNKFWVVVDRGRFIRYPTGDDLRGTIIKSYSPTNICSICRYEYEKYGIELIDKSILYPGNVRHNTDKNGKKTNEWLCNRHGNRYDQRYNPDSSHNLEKYSRYARTGKLDQNCPSAKGIKGEKLTDGVFGTKRLSIIKDNYGLSYDHTPLPEGVSVEIGGTLIDLSGKILQTKISNVNFSSWIAKNNVYEYEYWQFGNLKREADKIFDIEIIWCISRECKSIDRGYTIPREIAIENDNIYIYKHKTINAKDYEQYRITDKELLRKGNNIWKKILLGQI